jgi:hypothetical protein
VGAGESGEEVRSLPFAHLRSQSRLRALHKAAGRQPPCADPRRRPQHSQPMLLRRVLHWVPIGVACDCCNTTAPGDDLLRREPGKPTGLRPPASLSPSGERGQLARLSDFTTETLSSAVEDYGLAAVGW